MRETFAILMNEVCHDVEIEPKLQPMQCQSLVNNSTTTEDEHDLTLKQTDSGVLGLAALSFT